MTSLLSGNTSLSLSKLTVIILKAIEPPVYPASPRAFGLLRARRFETQHRVKILKCKLKTPSLQYGTPGRCPCQSASRRCDSPPVRSSHRATPCQSLHHSHTFPDISYIQRLFGAFVPTSCVLYPEFPKYHAISSELSLPKYL